MAEKKTSFPMLPGTHWWTLRDKFKQSIPGVVTDSYLAAALDVQVKSARANVLPYLEDIGLIDKDGKTQELARAWRDDDRYAEVCKQMRERLYPADLLAAAPNPAQDRAPAERWLANHTGAGASAVKRMAKFYAILVEADATKQMMDAPAPGRTRKPKEIRSKKERQAGPISGSSRRESIVGVAGTNPTGARQTLPPTAPGVSINLQIHISADATPDQIDKIFESMAKHIYRK